MAWKKYNKETQQWEENPEADKLWDKYCKVVDEIYSVDDWNNAGDPQRQYYSSTVVKTLIKEWSDDEITELMPLLYEARNVREWQILRDMGY